MTPGTHVKALRNHNRVELGTRGIVIPEPKGSLSKPDIWVWVRFEGVFMPKLMQVSEVEVIGPIDYIV